MLGCKLSRNPAQIKSFQLAVENEFGLVNREVGGVYQDDGWAMGRGKCAKSGNNVCLVVNCPESQPKRHLNTYFLLNSQNSSLAGSV